MNKIVSRHRALELTCELLNSTFRARPRKTLPYYKKCRETHAWHHLETPLTLSTSSFVCFLKNYLLKSYAKRSKKLVDKYFVFSIGLMSFSKYLFTNQSLEEYTPKDAGSLPPLPLQYLCFQGISTPRLYLLSRILVLVEK